MLAVGSDLWKIAEAPAPIEMVEARRAIIRPLIEEHMQFVEANFVLDYKPAPAQPEANEVDVPVEEGTSSKRQLHKTCFHASHPLSEAQSLVMLCKHWYWDGWTTKWPNLLYTIRSGKWRVFPYFRVWRMFLRQGSLICHRHYVLAGRAP